MDRHKYLLIGSLLVIGSVAAIYCVKRYMVHHAGKTVQIQGLQEPEPFVL